MLKIIFPDICPGCDSLLRKGDFCSPCESKIEFIEKESTCAKCGDIFNTYKESISDSYLCVRCIRNDYLFLKCRSIAKHSGFIKELVHKFKYRKKTILGKLLSRVIVNHFPKDFDFFDTIVPVPLDEKKIRDREYNQSAIFAKNISKEFDKIYDPFSLLRHVEETNPQYEIKNLRQRKENVKGVFEVDRKNRLKNSSVLLIDDVFTTGSTVNECTKALLNSGVSKVQVLTLTRVGV